MTEIKKAWGNRYVKRGFLGTILIAIGSLTPAYLPQASPVWSLLKYLHLTGMITKWVGTAIVLAGLLLLIEAWFQMRHETGLRHWAVLLIWAVPFLVSPPIFSHDVYSYAAHGWLIQNGISPYDVGPGTLPGGYADQVSWVWRFTPSPYGPLALRISHLLCWMTGFAPFWSAIMMRIPALIGVGMIGMFLPRIARLRGVDPHMVGWFAILNPIMVIDYVGGAHNDSLMVGLMVFAIWLACQTRWWVLGAVITGVAATIKQPALMTAVALPFLVSPWTSWRPKDVGAAVARVATALAVSIGTFMLISIATRFWFGWMNAVSVPGQVLSVAPFSLLGWLAQMVLSMLGFTAAASSAMQIAQLIGLITSIAIICYLGLRRLGKEPLFFLTWSYLAVAICGPALHAWYALWGGVLLPLSKPSEKTIDAAVFATLIMLTFAAINLSNRNQAWALGVAVAGGIYWLLHTHRRSLNQRRGEDVPHVG